MFGEKSYIKKCKNNGIDIIVDSGGFKTTYYVYSKFSKDGERFESFKAVKAYCDALLQFYK